jgi:Mg2+ and Co2+ transporter CorA
MNIKRDEEGLSTEVEQLYHYVTMANDDQRNNEAEKLSVIATLFLVPNLITGIWGMNLGNSPDLNIYYWIYTAVVFVLAVYIIIQLYKGKRK